MRAWLARLGRMAHVCCRFGWFHWCFVHVSFADLGQPSNPQHQVPSPQGWGHFLRCSSFTYCIHLTSNILQDLAAFSSILFASVFGLPSNGSIRQYCHLSQCSLLSTQTQSLGQRMLGWLLHLLGVPTIKNWRTWHVFWGEVIEQWDNFFARGQA